jgi:outer membrane beta-barrel protein
MLGTIQFAMLFSFSAVAYSQTGIYRKSTESDEVVLNKLYPKKGRVELSLPNVGAILNQSYIDTYVISGSINYYWNEAWGMGVEGVYALNQDRSERECIENFYNNNDYKAPQTCGGPGGLGGGVMNNYGPAYVPIREYNYLFGAHAIWSPVYGKQIFALAATGHFDLFISMGGGMAFSTYYPLQETLKNGKKSRGISPSTAKNSQETNLGAEASDTNSYGKNGRPAAQSQSHPYASFGIGQKMHFARRFSIKAELKNYTVLGTQSGFDNFFTLTAGAGMRF